jgi:hypothetical protein
MYDLHGENTHDLRMSLNAPLSSSELAKLAVQHPTADDALATLNQSTMILTGERMTNEYWRASVVEELLWACVDTTTQPFLRFNN